MRRWLHMRVHTYTIKLYHLFYSIYLVLFQQELCWSSHCLHFSHHRYHNHSSPAIIILCHVYTYTSLFSKIKKTRLSRMTDRLLTDTDPNPKPRQSHYSPPPDNDNHWFDDCELLVQDELNCPVYTAWWLWYSTTYQFSTSASHIIRSEVI